MVTGIQKDWEIPVTDTDEAKLFDKIFLGNRNSLLKRDLQDVSRRVCFILGGSDNVTKYKSILNIEPDEHGLATLKLPGINHFLSSDMYWNKWFTLIISTIAQFDNGAGCFTLTRNQIIEEFITIQKKYGIFKCPQSLSLENISNEEDKQHFCRVLYATEGSYKNLETAVTEMYLTLDKMANSTKQCSEIKDYPYKDLIGQKAIAKYKIEKKIISELLKEQRCCAEKGINIPRIGDLFLRNKILTKEQIDELEKK